MPGLNRRHSLVTPIDWKQACLRVWLAGEKPRRHSLVTPIDWKHGGSSTTADWLDGGRHSLVTPIDWKLDRVDIGRHAEARSPFFGDAY